MAIGVAIGIAAVFVMGTLNSVFDPCSSPTTTDRCCYGDVRATDFLVTMGADHSICDDFGDPDPFVSLNKPLAPDTKKTNAAKKPTRQNKAKPARGQLGV